MTVANLIDYIRLLTRTTSAQFSDNELLELIKIWLHKVQRAVAMARADFFVVKSYTSPELDQEDIPLPDDCIEIKAVEVCYNANQPVEQQIWYKAEEIDVGQLQVPWDTIQKRATKEHPLFDVLDNRLWIAPIRKSVVGKDTVVKVRLWYTARPPDPSTTSDTPLITTLNQNLLDYQPIIALGVCYDVLLSLGSPRAIEFYHQYVREMEKMIKEIKQQNIGAIVANIPYNDGSQY